MSGFKDIVLAVESRYDFLSARTLTREALGAAGLKEQPKYSPEELGKFADGLSSVGSNLDSVWAALGVAPSGQALPAAAPAEEAKDDKKKDAKKKDAKADDGDEKADDKPAEKKPAKKKK